jgi:hypothetical protein
LGTDVGSVGVPGNTVYDDVNGVWMVTGDGGDIWGGADALHYACRPMRGDGEIVVYITALNQEEPHDWSKAGVMIRETLAGGSAQASVLMTGTNGVQFCRRSTTGGGSSADTMGGLVPPCWLRIVRSGDNFSAFLRPVPGPPPPTWLPLGAPQNIPMSQDVYVGIGVCSHRSNKLATGVFEQVTWPAAPFNEPWALSPDDGAIGMPVEGVQLSWMPGDDTKDVNGHNVYLGTVSPPPLVSNQTATTYDTGPLEYGTMYYWQIGELSNPETLGPERSFKTARAGVGEILGQIWWNIGGTQVPDLTGNPRYPHSPDQEMMLPRLEAPTDIGDNFGGRIVGYLYPETSGDYTFWIASDDASALYLSTSESLCDAVKICGHNAWTGSRDWTAGPRRGPIRNR